ncbi:unnamed protein product [Clonostachys rhizophaga]|uniref:Uncharacterized protein n=1 Tax=Clonostachys rhizophaga TaxID=160324 RepID=A0A9N9VIA0_9HYPO|nr:unnamed protein product [Clonostachys rhizophaga]
MAGELSAEAAEADMKAAELGLGMEAGMAAWHAIWDKLVGSEKDAFKRKMDACDGAYKTLQPVLTDWNTWLMTHCPDCQSFGTTRAGGVTISMFQAFEVAPALTTATRTVNAPGLSPLTEKLEELCNKMLQESNAIASDFTEMRAKDLKDHKAELEGVLKTL